MVPAQREGTQSEQRSGSNVILQTVLESIAGEVDADPLDLPPLFETIDPDALEDIVTSSGTATMQVTFLYAGCEITVTGDGAVSVEEQSSADNPD